MFAAKNILVTGGAGFIGSHLCESLLRDGHRVICADNFSTGFAHNINHLLQHPSFRFLRQDINMPFDLEVFPELAAFKIPFQGIQEIYHLACPTSIARFDQFKTQTLLSNSTGTFHTLEIARKYRAKILLASSSVVYGGRQEGEPFVEEEAIGCVDHLSARSCYDEGKRFAETMFETYRQVYELPIRIARIFRTYGPRMPLSDGHLIPDFILHALDGKDLVLNGGLDFRTSLLYVTDALDGMRRLMEASSYEGPVNIGSDVDMRLEEVAQKIIAMTQSSSRVVAGENYVFLSELALPRITKAKQLGWIPLVRLEEGLARTIEYLKAHKILLTEI
jgi:UDP-glucuronate decarboxylase